jgi:glycosyltransferase involved in cell wall biosynthesis
VATLASAKPLIVSLMGSDVIEGGVLKPAIRHLAKKYWTSTIVKSNDMKQSLNYDYTLVLPNGVDTTFFKPIDRNISVAKVKWDPNKIHVLFAASKDRPEKNYTLFAKALAKINVTNIEVHTLEDIDHDLMPYYYNASNVIVLLSKHEGSPNVIKEAMACNRPIVATDVGDIKENIDTTEGCFVVNADPIEVADKIIKAITYEQTNGRFKIRHLRSEIISDKLIELYNNIM